MGGTSAALTGASPGEPARVEWLEAGAPQAEGVIPLIGRLMEKANLEFTALERIAVCVGPGGFSGIRAGVAAARGIGLAAGVPVCGATSLAILAAAFEERHGEAPEVYGLAAPAGAGVVYCQILGRGGKALSGILALPYAGTAAFFEGKAELLAGPAAQSLVDNGYVRLPVSGADLMPDAGTLARLAPALNPARDLPSPYYVRPPDARPQTRHLISRLED